MSVDTVTMTAFAWHPDGFKTKTFFSSEGPTQNLMFTNDLSEYFVLPDLILAALKVSLMTCFLCLAVHLRE